MVDLKWTVTAVTGFMNNMELIIIFIDTFQDSMNLWHNFKLIKILTKS